MIYLGDFATGQSVYIPFHTFNAAGASVTLTGLDVTDIEIYRDGVTTQRASDNGVTLLDTDGIDFDGITGLHGVKIDLSDNSDSGFFAAGYDYMVAISAVTVDGQTVSFWAATFSIQNRYMRGTDSAATAANLATLSDYVDTEVAAIKAVTDAIPAALTTIAGQTDTLESGQTTIITAISSLNDVNVEDILDGIIEGDITLAQSLQISNAALGGKISGADTTQVTIRNASDSKNRIVATVDETGNRTGITLDLD